MVNIRNGKTQGTTNGKRLAGLGSALLLVAFLAPAGAAALDSTDPHPCREPWAAAGNHGGKADRHAVGRQAVKHCSAESIKEAANVRQPDREKKPVADR